MYRITFLMIMISRWVYQHTPTLPDLCMYTLKKTGDMYKQAPFKSLAYLNTYHYYQMLVQYNLVNPYTFGAAYYTVTRDAAKAVMRDFSKILHRYPSAVTDERFATVRGLIGILQEHVAILDRIEQHDPKFELEGSRSEARLCNYRIFDDWLIAVKSPTLSPEQFVRDSFTFSLLTAKARRFYEWNYGIFGFVITNYEQLLKQSKRQ